MVKFIKQEGDASDLLNKYIEYHEQLVDLLVAYYPIHASWIERQNPTNSIKLRREFKKMKRLLKTMEVVVQERMHERSNEWHATHPDYKKGRNNYD